MLRCAYALLGLPQEERIVKHVDLLLSSQPHLLLNQVHARPSVWERGLSEQR